MKKPTQKNQQTSDPEKLSNPETSNPEKSSNLLPRKIINPTWKNQTQKFKTIQHPQGKKKPWSEREWSDWFFSPLS